MLLRFSVIAIALCAAGPAAPAVLRAQTPTGEAAVLADGWSRLAKGDAAGAAQIASAAIAREPRSTAALVLAVDADLVRGGTTMALDTYERWLEGRRLDEAHVLRRVARALLLESSAKQQPNVTARIEALRALAADGDTDASATLERAAFSGAFGETRALATIGDDRAVNMLIAQLAPAIDKTPIIDALANSGSKLAVRPLTDVLSDPKDIHRAAAADALARLGAVEAIPQLRTLLKDQFFFVKLKAAGALFRLNDSSGLALLTEQSQSPHAAVRVAAARELASQPDVAWQALVRSLTVDPDPVVRLDAAKLIAPYDQQLAKQVVDGLMRDENLAVREAASGALVDRIAADFPTLRRLLRSGDAVVRVKAAGRMLELTR
jgi:HEAT repeat protein